MADRNRFRVILLGCGARAHTWDQVIFRHTDTMCVVAYVNRTIAKAEAFSREHEGWNIPFFSSIEEALDAVEADAVIMVTPPEGHKKQILAIAKNGLPILAEKPLGMSLEEGRDIMDIADAYQIPISMSLQFRYLPVSQELKRICKSGELGKAGFGLFSYIRNRNGMRPDLNKYPLTMEQPMLLEQTIHHYDLIRYCYGSEPIWIECHTWNPDWSMYADDSNVMSMMELENGMRVSYFGTWTSGRNGEKEIMFNWRTDFSNGVVIQEDVFEHLVYGSMNADHLERFPDSGFKAFLDDTDALLMDFVDAVRSGRAVPCDGRDHLKSLAMVTASIEAAKSGKRVYLDKKQDRCE